MPEILGEEIEKIITGVKRAVKVAQQSSLEGQVVEVEKIELIFIESFGAERCGW